ncbi:MAG: bis(5'-nucleosyl)-tetraphosphatase (symmetrical) YqeK [Clostridiales bacterium]|nr:bis(5'-nucleosyl)-tetraphosphatase (symmetrical) YqeK [Clostridiales bacterium]
MDEAKGQAGYEAASACFVAGVEARWLELRERMEWMLKPKRFIHSLAVADESVAMGRRFGGDLARLALAGLVHDGAKGYGDEELLALGEAEGLFADPAQRENLSLLHGPAAAWLAKREWGIDDPAILEAVALHTTGEAGMSLEAGIVFMADLIEPGREYAGVDVLRRLCREDLQAAMIEAIEQTFVYLKRVGLPLHQGTNRCLEWLRTERGITWKAKN